MENDLKQMGDIKNQEKELLNDQIANIKLELESKISEYDENKRVLNIKRAEEIKEQELVLEKNEQEIQRLRRKITETEKKERDQKIKYETEMDDLKRLTKEQILTYKQEQEMLQK